MAQLMLKLWQQYILAVLLDIHKSAIIACRQTLDVCVDAKCIVDSSLVDIKMW